MGIQPCRGTVVVAASCRIPARRERRDLLLDEDDIVSEDADAVDRLELLITNRTPVAVSTLTVFEVGIGLQGASQQYRKRFRDTIDELEEHPLGAS